MAKKDINKSAVAECQHSRRLTDSLVHSPFACARQLTNCSFPFSRLEFWNDTGRGRIEVIRKQEITRVHTRVAANNNFREYLRDVKNKIVV
jgi:hypothetical protein